MVHELSEYELDIIYKITRKNRWCKKHISKEHLIRGFPKHELGNYKKAIDSLIKKGYLTAYKRGNRIDVCVNKKMREEIIDLLELYDYPTIKKYINIWD